MAWVRPPDIEMDDNNSSAIIVALVSKLESARSLSPTESNPKIATATKEKMPIAKTTSTKEKPKEVELKQPED
jgi:hypothetical protein